MGRYYLDKQVEWLERAGLAAEWYQYSSGRSPVTASRSTGGYEGDTWAIQLHHDASPSNWDVFGSARYGAESHKYAPVGALRGPRNPGEPVVVIAGGATNTSGKGGPLKTSTGVIPLNGANPRVISFEWLNNGLTEGWLTWDMYCRAVAAYVLGLATDGAFDAWTGEYVRFQISLVEPGDIHSHFEWRKPEVLDAAEHEITSGTATDKIDPADAPGSTPFGRPSHIDRYGRWTMPTVRQYIRWHYLNLKYPNAIIEEGNTMNHPTARGRLAVLNMDRGVAQIVRIPKVDGLVPVCANLKIHVTGAVEAGRVEVYAKGVAPGEGDGNHGSFGGGPFVPISIPDQPCDENGDVRIRVVPGGVVLGERLQVYVDLEGCTTQTPPEATRG